MGVVDLLRRVAGEAGIEDDEITTLLADDSSPEIDFDQELPGTAAEVLEVFLDDSTTKTVEDENGWIWAPLIRSGQHAMRPGPRGQKVRKPLKVVTGKSKDPLKEIGLGDLVEAFEGDAVDYVTVPTSHQNSSIENTGFIRGMKVMSAPIATGPNKGKKVPTLFGGYDFTEPDIKGKVKRGTIPGRSCGILYNYENTETGQSWPSVVEHVALTSKPWIRGMTPFGRKLSERADKDPIQMSLTDEEPVEENDDVEALLADGDTVTWTHEDSPNWLRQQVNQILDAARAEKRRKIRANSSNSFVEEMPPYYRASDAKHEGDGGKALISDGYGDGSNYWVANFTLDGGTISLDDFKEWQPVKSVYISDDRDPPDKKNEPLDERRQEMMLAGQGLTRLQRAQMRRKARVRGEDLSETKNPTHPRGGEKMDPSNSSNGSGTLDFSEEARKRIEAAEARAEAADRRAEELGEMVGTLTSESRDTKVKSFLDELREMGLDEKHGQTGFLNEVSTVLSADDGEPALTSEAFSEDGKTDTAITLTDAFRRVFSAFKKGEDGKIALGEQLEQPSDDSIKASEDKPDGSDGKPPKDEKEDEFSVEGARERAAKLTEDNPELARIAPGAVKKDGGDA